MGLFNALRGGNDSTSDNEPDGYRVVRQTDKGGWKPVEPFDQLDEPITKQTFEYNAAPIDPGEYRLFVLNGNLQTELSGEQGWKLEVEGNTDRSTERDERIAELRRKLESMHEEQADSSTQNKQLNSDEAAEERKASVQLAALQSEPFIEQYGEDLILSMLGISSDDSKSSVEHDDSRENSVSASIYESHQEVVGEPEQAERSKTILDQDMDSFLNRAGDQQRKENTSGDYVDGAQPDEQSEDNELLTSRNVDPGPSSMAELKAEGGHTLGIDELHEKAIESRTN